MIFNALSEFSSSLNTTLMIMGVCGAKLQPENEYPRRDIMTPSHSNSHSHEFDKSIKPKKIKQSARNRELTSTEFNKQLREIADRREKEEKEREAQQKKIMQQNIAPIEAPAVASKPPKSLSLKQRQILSTETNNNQENDEEVFKQIRNKETNKRHLYRSESKENWDIASLDRHETQLEIELNKLHHTVQENNTKDVKRQENNDEKEWSIPTISDSESNDSD